MEDKDYPGRKCASRDSFGDCHPAYYLLDTVASTGLMLTINCNCYPSQQPSPQLTSCQDKHISEVVPMSQSIRSCLYLSH